MTFPFFVAFSLIVGAMTSGCAVTTSGTGVPAPDAGSLAPTEPVPLEDIAQAHDRVAAGTRERIILAIPD